MRNEDNYLLRLQKSSDAFFHKITASTPYPLSAREQGVSYLFPDTRIQFITLNSAWRIDRFHRDRSGVSVEAVTNAIDNAERERMLAIGRGELDPDATLLRIGVWHHPISGEKPMKDLSFLDRLQRCGVSLVLHGDAHEVRSGLLGHHSAHGQLEVIGAGSLGARALDRPEATARAYNLLEIRRDLSSIRVHTREQPTIGSAWGGIFRWPASASGDARYPYFDIRFPAM